MKTSYSKKHYLTSICFVALLASIPFLSISRPHISPQDFPGTQGPETDVLRFKTIRGGLPRPPPEYFYVDGYLGGYEDGGWTNVGASLIGTPDGNFAESTLAGATTGWYTFENITLDGREIENIDLEGYTRQPDGVDNDFDPYIFVYNATGHYVGLAWCDSLGGSSGWAWTGGRYYQGGLYDMPEYYSGTLYPADFLHSEEGFNNMQLYIENYGTSGPRMQIDALRWRVEFKPEPGEQPTLPVRDMQMGQTDALPDLMRTYDLEKLDNECYTITHDLSFHVGYIAYNIRDTATINTIRALRGLDPVSYWSLHDVEFRHALIHSYDQLSIIPTIHGYIATPIRSLVPPGQSKYYNVAVPTHPFNQGDPFDPDILVNNPHSTVGILKAAGYTFEDRGTIGVVDDADRWLMPNSDPLPYMEIWTPLATDAPTAFEHGVQFVSDLANIGLAATSANGPSGLYNVDRDYGEYLNDVYGTPTSPGGQFDAYMAFHDLGRLPDQLYSLLHSSQDSYTNWGQSNAPGVNNGTIDTLTETIKYSLNTDDIEVAAKAVQAMLYTPDKTTYPDADNFALAYMTLYSRAYTNAFNRGLRGIVKSPGFGSKNMWTFLNMRWELGTERLEDADGDGDDETVVIWRNALPPDTLNPTYASRADEWNIIGQTQDGLTAVNPYNHYDIPWIATDWDIRPTPGGMEIDFTLRNDVYWQDGYQVTASDVEFALEFYRDWNTINFAEQSAVLTDVIVTDATHLTISTSEAGLSLFYDYAGSAMMLPPQIWDRDWGTSANVLNYHPEDHAYGSDMAPGYAAGPWASNVPTNLFGTGPWTYQFYDWTIDFSDLWANRNYFMSKTGIDTLKTEMFWEVGDVNRDGVIDQIDKDRMDAALGSIPGDPNWDPDCDLNQDGWVDIFDSSILDFYFGWYREYPADITDVAILEVTTYPTAVPGQQVPISVKAKNKGLTDRTVNFTYYYDDTLIGFQIVTLPPCQSNVSYTWDTTGIPEGTYTIKVNATVIDGPDIYLDDNLYVDGQIQLVIPTISVEPQRTTVGSTGKNFSININIANAPYNNTWAWEFKLSWNATLLNITDINEGTFLNQSGTWGTLFVNFTNQDEGWVLASGILTEDPIQQGQPLPHGNGTLAILNFTVLNLGNDTLHLSDTILLDYNVDPYIHTTQDGEFEVLLGDINRDGIVDDADKEIIVQAYGSTPGSPNWNPEADIWGPNDEPDGFVNVYDLAMWGKKHE